MNKELFKAITDFAAEYGSLKWKNPQNVAAFRELVDLSIKAGKIPACNRNEPSTWGRLQAAVTYYDNRLRFCAD